MISLTNYYVAIIIFAVSFRSESPQSPSLTVSYHRIPAIMSFGHKTRLPSVDNSGGMAAKGISVQNIKQHTDMYLVASPGVPL